MAEQGIAAPVYALAAVAGEEGEDIAQRSGAAYYLAQACDVIMGLPDGQVCVACLRRSDVRDVLLATDEAVHLENRSRRLHIAAVGAHRGAGLWHFFPEAATVDVCDWTVAVEGLLTGLHEAILAPLDLVKSAGYAHLVVQRMNPTHWLPAPGQGICLLLAPEGTAPLPMLHHRPTWAEWETEQAFAKYVSTTTAALPLTLAMAWGEQMILYAGLLAADGRYLHRDSAEGPLAGRHDLALQLARRMCDELLHRF
ncbi:MAG: hypothetical protein OHK0039_04170 [Bacteroidia bacterium]